MMMDGYRGGTGDSFNTGRRGQPDGGILGDPGITPGGGGGLDWKKRGMKLLFGATVHLAGILDKAKSIYDTYDKMFDKDDTQTSIEKKETKLERKIEYGDTITRHVDLYKTRETLPYDTIAKVSRDIRGYKNAMNYANYHINMNTPGYVWRIQIQPKNEE
ncbi:hypothetical protein [Aquimarina sp. I32.4]|uniref:hypothetical protein n=1 Tax=Aquimarina sp. I32.4 TaxID=2053903 RepID=UPI000CDE9C46|nr:hypothetical protein [Aquimarina sp. I32.4]